MNVIAAHVRSQEMPVSMAAHFVDGFHHNNPARFIEKIRGLIHQLMPYRDALRTRPGQRCSRHVVMPIHRASIIAMQAGAVADKSDEVTHRGRSLPLPYGHGSVSR